MECPQPTGRCCIEGLDCLELTEEHCANEGGEYAGNGTECFAGACEPPPTGRCCIEGAGCFDFTEEHCAAEGGEYAGDGTECFEGACEPPPTGRCCFAEGGCAVLTEEHCGNEGGDWAGEGTECFEGACPDPSGACCFDDGSCLDLTEGNCDLEGGDYQGDGSHCSDDNACSEGFMPWFREFGPSWPPGILWRPAAGMLGPPAPFVDDEPLPPGIWLVFYRIENRNAPDGGAMHLGVRKHREGGVELDWR